MPEGTVLGIDDDEFLRQAVARTLALEGYTVRQAASAYHGLAALREHAAEVLGVLSDVKLPDGHGLDLLPRYKTLAPLAEVILLTAVCRARAPKAFARAAWSASPTWAKSSTGPLISTRAPRPPATTPAAPTKALATLSTSPP